VEIFSRKLFLKYFAALLTKAKRISPKISSTLVKIRVYPASSAIKNISDAAELRSMKPRISADASGYGTE
jgi:hypothetical protein